MLVRSDRPRLQRVSVTGRRGLLFWDNVPEFLEGKKSPRRSGAALHATVVGQVKKDSRKGLAPRVEKAAEILNTAAE